MREHVYARSPLVPEYRRISFGLHPNPFAGFGRPNWPPSGRKVEQIGIDHESIPRMSSPCQAAALSTKRELCLSQPLQSPSIFWPIFVTLSPGFQIIVFASRRATAGPDLDENRGWVHRSTPMAIWSAIDESTRVGRICGAVFASQKYSVPRRTKEAFVPTLTPALGNYQRSYSSISFRESLDRDSREPPRFPAALFPPHAIFPDGREVVWSAFGSARR